MNKLIVGLLIAFLALSPAQAQNYSANQGTQITFSAASAAGILTPRFIFCDNTTPTQCLAVNPSGQVTVIALPSGTYTVSGTVTANAVQTGAPWLVSGTVISIPSASPQSVSAASLPLPTGAAISATQGTTADAPATLPATTTAASEIALLKAIANVGQYPSGAIAITASATGTTAATTATLAAAASGHTTYICSYSVRANATAATTVQNTVTGVITATMTHQMWVAPAASGIGIDEQVFNPCVPASTTATAIAVVSGAPGSGGLVSVTATGYQL